MYRRFVHPRAKAIAGIDLTRIQESAVGKLAVSQMESTGWKKKAAEAGLDFAADVERLVLSSPGESASATLSEEAPFVAAMQGKFKIDKLRKGLAAKRAQRFLHQGAEVWTVAQSDVSLAIVNSQVMLVGDRQSLRAVLDAQSESAGAEPGEHEQDQEENGNPVQRRAAELASTYDIWAVSEASMEWLAKGGEAAGLPPGVDAFRNTDEFELGISFRQGFVTDVSFHGRTPADTARLASLLSGFKAMASLSVDPRKKPELGALLDKLKVGTSGERAVVSVSISRDEIETAIAAASSAKRKPTQTAAAPSTPAQPQLVAAMPPPPPPAAAAPPPPPPFVVRIYNAEGGTREVPLKR